MAAVPGQPPESKMHERPPETRKRICARQRFSRRACRRLGDLGRQVVNPRRYLVHDLDDILKRRSTIKALFFCGVALCPGIAVLPNPSSCAELGWRRCATLRVHLVNTVPSERGTPVILTAAELITSAAERDGPIEFARIATLRRSIVMSSACSILRAKIRDEDAAS